LAKITSKPFQNRGPLRALRAVRFSLKGLKYAVLHESAFRQELLLALVMIPAAFLLEPQPLERMWLVSSVLLVLVVELLNTAVEAVVDRIGTEFNELAGLAKDLGSAAVMLTLLLCGYIWLEVLLN